MHDFSENFKKQRRSSFPFEPVYIDKEILDSRLVTFTDIDLKFNPQKSEKLKKVERRNFYSSDIDEKKELFPEFQPGFSPQDKLLVLQIATTRSNSSLEIVGKNKTLIDDATLTFFILFLCGSLECEDVSSLSGDIMKIEQNELYSTIHFLLLMFETASMEVPGPQVAAKIFSKHSIEFRGFLELIGQFVSNILSQSRYAARLFQRVQRWTQTHELFHSAFEENSSLKDLHWKNFKRLFNMNAGDYPSHFSSMFQFDRAKKFINNLDPNASALEEILCDVRVIETEASVQLCKENWSQEWIVSALAMTNYFDAILRIQAAKLASANTLVFGYPDQSAFLEIENELIARQCASVMTFHQMLFECSTISLGLPLGELPTKSNLESILSLGLSELSKEYVRFCLRRATLFEKTLPYHNPKLLLSFYSPDLECSEFNSWHSEMVDFGNAFVANIALLEGVELDPGRKSKIFKETLTGHSIRQ